MKKFSTLLLFTAVLATSTSSIAVAKDAVPKDAGAKKAKKTTLAKDERLDFIRRAQVWQPTNVAEMDLRAGPQGKDAFAFDAQVTCDYVEVKLPGSSRKFDCKFAEGDVAKVRYGVANGEVEGNVLATRLLWALGFGADRVYPVRVTCRGCSPDPWTNVKKTAGEQTFDLAAVERKPEGHEMKTRGKASGWAWTELALVDEAQGGATRAQRDALTLLAVFMQHTDSKPEQQRLVCLPGGLTEAGVCEKPFLAIHDVGLTFGHANFYNRNVTSSVNFSEWSKTPVWRDANACVAHQSKSKTGTLGDPTISEGGRAFLAGLLTQLSDTQLHDLFEVSHVDRRRNKLDGSDAASAASVDAWVDAFKRKRDEIVTTRCPA